LKVKQTSSICDLIQADDPLMMYYDFIGQLLLNTYTGTCGYSLNC